MLLSLLAGIVAAWIVGPRRWWAAIVPALAAFGSLYLLGHRWVVNIGPSVEVFGWDVALPFDAAVALVTALVAAGVQLSVARLLKPQQRDPGGDGLA